MRLSEAMKIAGRDNNFNLLRMLAAIAVLVSHSYALALGDPHLEPFTRSLGMSLGELSVDVFFITSGFLICGSLFSRQDPLRFITARCMRIYPALLVVVLLTALALGPLMTNLEPSRYFSDRATWTYIARTGPAVFGNQDTLPGVFQGNPFRGSVNGSLWTLQYEICMYGLVFAYWMFTKHLRLSSRSIPATMAALTVAGMLAYWGVSLFVAPRYLGAHKVTRLFAMFFMGSNLWFYRDLLILRPTYAVAAASVLMLATYSRTAFLFIFPACMCYLIIFFVFAVTGKITRYNDLGDYSYGVYILAFPIQQTIAALIPGVGVAGMILLSSLVIIPLSIFSWVFIESKALALIPIATQRLGAVLGDIISRTRQFVE